MKKNFSLPILIPYISLVLLTLISDPVQTLADDANQLLDNAYTAMRQGNTIEALHLYEKALEAAPESDKIWQEYTSCLRMVKRFQRAIIAGWRTLELDSNNYLGWANIGNIYLECNAWPQAYDAFLHAEALCPDKKWSAANFLNLGYAVMQNGESSQACKAIEHALTLDPGSRLAHFDYALYLGSTGQSDKAKIELHKGLKGSSNDKDDSQTIAFGQKILETLEKDGKLTFPASFATSRQFLPSRFLNRPSINQAQKLPVEDMVNRIFSLGDGTSFTISTPESWIESFEVVRESFFTVRLDLPGTPPCSLLITPLPLAMKHYNPQNAENDVKKMGEILMPHATDKELVVFPLAREKDTFGFVFTITDKNWKDDQPGDFPHATQGIIVINDMPFTFTLLSHSREMDFRENFLNIIRRITIQKKPQL